MLTITTSPSGIRELAMPRLRLALVVLLFTVGVASADGPVKRHITVEDLWKIKRLGPPAISPDGAWCCVEVTTWNLDKDEGMSELWLLATDGSQQRQLTNSGGRNSGPRWSADGQWIAFTSKRSGDEVAQIYVISPAGGEARRVAKTSFAPSSLKWSYDGKTIFAIGWTWPDCTSGEEHRRREKEQKDAKSKAAIITDGIFRYWDKWLTDGKRPVVFSFDVATGKHKNLLAGTDRHLPPFEPSAGDYDVSPDGKELCFVADNVPEFGLDANFDLFALDVTQEKSKPRCLTADNPAHDTNPVYSPDGKSIAFLRQTTKFFYADRNRVMILDRASGKASELCPPGRPLDRSAANPHWLPNDDDRTGPTVVAEVEDQGYVRTGILSANDPARLLPSGYSDRSLDVAAMNATMVFLRSSFDKPPQVWVGDPRGTKRRIDHFNDDLTSQWKLGNVENVTINGADNRSIQMWIVYPPEFDPTKKWPLVQMVHGGPHNAITTDFSYRWNPQLWAAQGWVVGIVNFHGSSGFGQEFTDSITGDTGTKALEDIMKATDWFAAKNWIDKNRMAAAGGSYGGYMMAWMNGHTDIFKAMVCHAGVYNWASMTASDLVRGRERSLGAPPWGDQTRIDHQNAQRFAANFKTPTLVVHGEKDYRVPVTQGFEYYNTLRQKGVPTRLLYFPDENHWVLKAHNSFVWHREVFGWLEKYIGKGPSE
jgi:dipeptidyl aminopeptidase/acylaminoacyl peptidase